MDSSTGITRSEARNIYASIGPLFDLCLGIGLAAVVAIGVLTALTAGAATPISNIILGIVMSVILLAILPVLISDIAVALIWGIEGDANGTANQHLYQLNWTAFADAVSWYDTGLSTTTATMALWVAWNTPGGKVVWLDTVAFAFSVVGAALAFFAYSHHSKALAIEGLVFGGIGLVTDGIAIVNDKYGAKRTLDISTGLLDVGVFGIALAELAS